MKQRNVLRINDLEILSERGSFGFVKKRNDCIRVKIVKDDLKGPEVAELLNDHLANMADHSSQESCHALDLTGLQQPDVFFYSVWSGVVRLRCWVKATPK